VSIAKPFAEYSKANFATMVGRNLAGFFHLTHRVAAKMLHAGSGSHRPYIHITVTIAVQLIASLAASLAALTRGGLNAITRSLAVEYPIPDRRGFEQR
jgi:NAD(P)-dependent dehydrogenase (short-subunit alcohol dehydrogenase family)